MRVNNRTLESAEEKALASAELKSKSQGGASEREKETNGEDVSARSVYRRLRRGEAWAFLPVLARASLRCVQYVYMVDAGCGDIR